MARNGVGRTAIVRRPDPPDVYEYDIERYLNVRSAFGASFRADGTLSFRTNTTGTPQVWTVPEAGAWPTQRTFYDERVTFASPSPERAETVFGMDEGGDERGSLFRLDDDGRITELTQPDAKHRWGGWSHDGDRIAFASNRRDESVFDVYVRPRDGTDGDARRLLEGDGWLSVAGWSPDDSRLLVHEARSNVDTDVYVLDVESGALAALTGEGAPGDGNTGNEAVRYKSLSWGPDGEYVYCCSDRDGDTLSLVRLDADDGGLETVVDGGTWNVDGVAIDDGTGRIAYSRNVDGYTELTVGDLDGERIDPRPDPELPAGLAGGVAFDDGADRFAVTVTTDTHNANVYVVDVETGAAERWTQAPTAGIPESTFVESDPVRYGTFDGREIPGYLSVPETVPEGGAPTIVDVHGGPESQRRPSFSALKQYFLAHGYAVFEPNVRGSTGYGREYAALDDVEKRMDAVADVGAAAAWLAARPEVDARGRRRPPDREGRLLRRVRDARGAHRISRRVGRGGRHRRHREFRHLPREHRLLAAGTPGGRVRLPRGRSGAPRVNLADQLDGPDRGAAFRPPRRERPPGSGRRGQAGRRGRRGCRRPRRDAGLRGRGPRHLEAREPNRGLRRDRRVPR